MTTDVALHHENGAALALPTLAGGISTALERMTEFTSTVRQVEAFVSALVDTPFVPEAHWPLPVGVKSWEMPNKSARMKHAKETGEDWNRRRQIACSSGTGAVLTGLPLGIDPLVALAQVFVVKGRPGLYTKLKVALAQAHGHEVWDVERSPEVAKVAGRRRGWPQDRVVTITITIEDARRAKWTENEAYEKTPEDMLWSRAASRVLDRIAADVLFGIPSIEDLEVDDEPAVDRPGASVTATVAPPSGHTQGAGAETLRQLVQQTVRDREAAVEVTKTATPEAFPPVAEEPAPVPAVNLPADYVGVSANPLQEDGKVSRQITEPPAPPAEPAGNVTRPQLSQISMLLGGRHGLGGPGSVAKRGRILSALVGRPLKTTQELTADEAATVIGYLENTDTPALLAMADAPPADPEREPAGTGSDPWDEPAERDGTDQ
jgi:hypothetical protein